MNFALEPRHLEALQTTLKGLSHLRVETSQLTILPDSHLGAGAFGEVFSATWTRPSQPPMLVAVKELAASSLHVSRVRTALGLARELKVWAELHHPNILELLGFYLHEEYLKAQLISRYMPNGSVTKYIASKKPSLESRLRLVYGITAGMTYLHSQVPPVCHGDLKPGNVLVSEHDDAVLCDFGLAKLMHEARTDLTTLNRTQGTSRFMSPELHDDEDARPNLESDIWAWACTVFSVVTDCNPYPNAKGQFGLLKAMFSGVQPGEPSVLDGLTGGVSPPFQSTLTALKAVIPKAWANEAKERPSFTWIQKHYPSLNATYLAAHYPRTERADTLETALREWLGDERTTPDSKAIPNDITVLRSTLGDVGHLWIPQAKLALDESAVAHGGVADIYRGILSREQRPSMEVAVKQIRVADYLRETNTKKHRLRLIKHLAREIMCWTKTSHPNVLEFVGFSLDARYSSAQLVSPYMSNGNARDFIAKEKPHVDIRSKIILGITSGMEYLHTRDPPICHGDFNPSKVLIADNGDAVLCGFELATLIQEPASGLTTTQSFRGTIRYVSPEVLETDDGRRTLPSDVWAWACTSFEVMTDLLPFSTLTHISQLIRAIFSNTPPGSIDLVAELAVAATGVSKAIIEVLVDLIPQCWRHEPDRRPTIIEIRGQLPS